MTGHFYPANTSQASKKFPGCPLKITVAVLTGQFLSGKLVFAKQKRASHQQAHALIRSIYALSPLKWAGYVLSTLSDIHCKCLISRNLACIGMTNHKLIDFCSACHVT